MSKSAVRPSPSKVSAGSIDGHLSVGAAGTAGYAVPVDVPPGVTRQATPVLGLAYGSTGPEGLAGAGWRLTGLSVITRCTVRRGAVYPIRYGSADRFCLDGQVLVATSGTYGADGTTYRTEIESWRTITSHGSCGAGPCSFTVVGKHGLTLEYGTTADSRIEARPDPSVNIPPGSLRAWAVARQDDLRNNAITYHYEVDANTGEYVPVRILYTVNDAATPPLAAQRAVQLSYTKRAEPLRYFQGGASIVYSRLLAGIETCVSERALQDCSDPKSIVTSYHLSYERSGITGRYRLTQIARTGRDGSRLPPTTFTYSDPASPSFSPPTSWSEALTSGWQGNVQPRRVVDVDGDGRADLVGFAQRGVLVALSTAKGFSDPKETSVSALDISGCSTSYDCVRTHPRAMADATGDGRADLVAFEDKSIRVAAADGHGSFSRAHPWSSHLVSGWGSDTERRVADLDGDGRADIIGFARRTVEFYYSDGSAFVARAKSSMTDFSADDGFSAATGNPPELADVNGDGRQDIVGFRQGEIWVGLSTGNGFLPRQKWTSVFDGPPGGWNPSTSPRRLADVNGDGLADVVGFRDRDVIVAYSTGQSFTVPVAWKDASFAGWNDAQGSQRIFGDVNGDGRADIVGMTRERVLFGVSDGALFGRGVVKDLDSSFGFGPIEQNPRYPASVTGDSVAALVVFGNEHVEVAEPPEPKPDMLTSIHDGLGGVTEITYGSIAAAGADAYYTPMAPPEKDSRYREYHRPLYVVTRTTHRDGRGGVYVYDHRYAGAVARADQKGFLGFQQHTVIDRQVNPTGSPPGRSTTTQYQLTFTDQDGTILADGARPVGREVARTEDGRLLGSDKTELAARATAPGVTFIYPEAETSTRYSLTSHRELTTRRTYAFDDAGNLLLLADLGQPDDPGEAVYQCTNYQGDAARGLSGFPAEIVVSSSACRVAHDRCTCPDKAVLTRREIGYTDDGRFLPARARNWDDQHATWLGVAFRWNDLAKEEAVTQAWWKGDQPHEIVTSHITYDPLFRTFPVEVSNPHFSIRRTYDPAFGVALTSTDPNGVVQSTQIDGFGRAVQQYGPSPDGKGQVVLWKRAWTRQDVGVKVVSQARTSWDDAWSTSTSYIDGLGRTYRETAASSAGKDRVRDVEYADLQTISRRSLPYFANESPAWIVYGYDDVGRPAKLAYPTGDEMSYRHDVATVAGISRATVVQQQLAGGKVLREATAYADGRGRVTLRVLPVEDGQQPAKVTYAYDPIGRLKRLEAPDGTATTRSYSSLGQIVAEDGDVRGRYDATFDETGRLSKLTFASGGHVELHYDDLGRLVKKTLEDADGTARAITYAWDESPAGDFGIGRLSSVSDQGDGALAQRFAYDAYGLVSDASTSIDGLDFHVTQTHDPAGRLVRRDFPDDGSAVEYSYGEDGAMLGVGFCGDARSCKANTFVPVATFSDFTPNLQARTVTYGNGVSTSYEFDVLGRWKESRSSLGGKTLFHQTYTWGDLTELQRVDDHVQAALTQVFTYGAPGYVTEARSGQATASYAYDTTGGLVEIKDERGDLRIHVDHQRAASATLNGRPYASFEYDANGRLRSRTIQGIAWTFDYDATGRLKKARGAGQVEGYRHDFAGGLVRRRDARGTTYYGPGGRTIEVLPGGGRVATTAIAGPGSVLATFSTGIGGQASGVQPSTGSSPPARVGGLAPGPHGPGIPVGGEKLYLESGVTGGTQLVTQSTGAVHARLGYGALGDLLEASSGTDTFRPKFDGRELSYASDLYAMGARPYEPSFGRFITPDSQLVGGPATNAASFNAYAFAGNNAVSYVDPSGHSFLSVLEDVGVGIGMAAVADWDPAAAAGLYFGGATVDHSWNPFHWKFDSWQTYAGMAGGVAITEASLAISVAAPEALPEDAVAAQLLVGVATDAAVGAGTNTAFAAMGGARGSALGTAAWQGAAMGGGLRLAGEGLGAVAGRAAATREPTYEFAMDNDDRAGPLDPNRAHVRRFAGGRVAILLPQDASVQDVLVQTGNQVTDNTTDITWLGGYHGREPTGELGRPFRGSTQAGVRETLTMLRYQGPDEHIAAVASMSDRVEQGFVRFVDAQQAAGPRGYFLGEAWSALRQPNSIATFCWCYSGNNEELTTTLNVIDFMAPRWDRPPPHL